MQGTAPNAWPWIQKLKSHKPAAGVDAIATLSAVPGEFHMIEQLYAGYDVPALATGGLLTIKFGGSPKLSFAVTGFLPLDFTGCEAGGLEVPTNTEFIADLDGVADTVGSVNVIYK